jgi:hypothetical protein
VGPVAREKRCFYRARVVKEGMPRLPLPLLVLCVVASGPAVGCGGSKGAGIAFGPPPARETRATLAGPRCEGGGCTCREPGAPGDGDVGLPPDSRKRFEIRVGPSAHELWVSVGEHQLYKSAERAEACFYVDLPSGSFPVTLRASHPDGVSVALAISELGARTRSFYETFRFSCGAPGVCSLDELADERARFAALGHGLHDKCGSVKVKGLTWDTGVAPDHAHPGDLALRLSLEVYRFAPWKPHGDATCGEGGGRGAVDVPAVPDQAPAGDEPTATSPAGP